MGGKTGQFIDDKFVYVSEEKARSLARNQARPGDLVFTQRGTLGQVVLIPERARFDRYIISQSQMKLTPNVSRVDARYLFHYFRSPRVTSVISSQTLATGVPHINLGILRRIKVVLPSLPEQRRIAQTLDRVDALRTKRRASLARLDELTQATFIDFFGEPLSGRWKSVRTDEAGRVQLGRQRGPQYQTGKHPQPYLRVANVFEDRLDLSDVNSMDFDSTDLASFRLEHGDVLLNEGQSTELVGRPAMWRGELPVCCFQNSLIRFQADRSRVEPEFALGVFRRHLRNGTFAKNSSKTSSVAHLGAGRFAAMPFPVPPRELQAQYAAQVARLRDVGRTGETSLARLDSLFASLSHRAFTGAL